MQERTREPSKMFEWHNGQRLMTVIRGIPMYRSSGRNSGYKDSWFPHMGIDGTNWIRKPKLCLPKDIIQLCKQLKFDEKFELWRFGTIQSLCISASLGVGLWKRNEGLELHHFLKKKYAQYFLPPEECMKILALQNTKPHLVVNNIATANSLLAQYGSWISVDFRSRLPRSKEYTFFTKTTNPKIRAALSMMLVRKRSITDSSFQMLNKLSENEKLLDYALTYGLLESSKNIKMLTKLLLRENKNLVLDDLIKMNTLHNVQLPLEYEYFKGNYSYRKVLRKLPDFVCTERELGLIKKIGDLQLLDRFGNLFLHDRFRQAMFLLDDQQKANGENLKDLWKMYKSEQTATRPFTPADKTNSVNKNLNRGTSLIKKKGLFGNESKSANSNVLKKEIKRKNCEPPFKKNRR